MNRFKTTLNPFLLLLPVMLCTGCPAKHAAPDAAATAVSAVAGRPLPTDETPRTDSIVCEDGCTEYTCYFTEDRLDRNALQNIRTVLFGYSWTYMDFESCPDIESVDRRHKRTLDSLASLAWLDGEPWPAMRKLFLEWSEQQMERNYIVYRGRRDPYFLYECSEKDSTTVQCADLLTKEEERRVEKIRQFLKANEYAKAARNSAAFDRSYLDYTLNLIDRRLAQPDSLYQAVEHVFQTLSNHINHKIHTRLGEDGTVDFNKYTDDFLAIFDSVKIETWEP